MAEPNDVDLDSIIDRLLEVRGSRPGKQVQLLETEIRFLCTKAREIFISQPILLELEAPIKVRSDHHCGFLHLLIYILDLRRYSWSILRSTSSVRIWWLSSRGKLSLPWRLRRPWKAITRDHLFTARIQDQISGKLFHPTRKSRMC